MLLIPQVAVESRGPENTHRGENLPPAGQPRHVCACVCGKCCRQGTCLQQAVAQPLCSLTYYAPRVKNVLGAAVGSFEVVFDSFEVFCIFLILELKFIAQGVC